jgi:hypothetical protein
MAIFHKNRETSQSEDLEKALYIVRATDIASRGIDVQV